MTNYENLTQATALQRRRLMETPVIVDCFNGQVDVDDYIAFLTQAYHHVRHTVPLLMTCGSRLPQRLEWLQPALVKYIEEEQGHEQWILNDIEACGGDAEAAAAGRPALATELMVSYAYDSVMRINPVSFFGMVFVLESTSAALATDAANALAGALQLPRSAFTYLSSHGSVDQEHIRDLAQIIDRLNHEEDLRAVLHTAEVMYELYRSVFESVRSMADGRSESKPTREVA